MTDRDLFLATLFTGPLLRGDAIVVLAGEDAESRLATTVELFKHEAAPVVVLSGGLDAPPAVLGCHTLAGQLLGMGLAPARVLVESGSTNTREQAVNVVELAVANGWRRLLLVASSYHLPRAFLTFAKALEGFDVPTGGSEIASSVIQVVPVPTSQAPWGQCPPGRDRTRRELFAVETTKITEYQALGHCASYAEGLEYLQQWEGK